VEDFRRIVGARVELIPACGHIPQLEKPAATRKAVAAFLRGLRA
jgi:pimeloyl-ACP methyl ester carboxylesterase